MESIVARTLRLAAWIVFLTLAVSDCLNISTSTDDIHHSNSSGDLSPTQEPPGTQTPTPPGTQTPAPPGAVSVFTPAGAPPDSRQSFGTTNRMGGGRVASTSPPPPSPDPTPDLRSSRSERMVTLKRLSTEAWRLTPALGVSPSAKPPATLNVVSNATSGTWESNTNANTSSTPTARSEPHNTSSATNTSSSNSTSSPYKGRLASPPAPGQSSTPEVFSSTRGLGGTSTNTTTTRPSSSTILLPTDSSTSPGGPIPGRNTITSAPTARPEPEPKQPCPTSSTQGPGGPACGKTRTWGHEASQCLIGICVLAVLLAVFVASTVVLCTRRSGQKYRLDGGLQLGTEMVCISTLEPQHQHYRLTDDFTSNGVGGGGGRGRDPNGQRALLGGPEDSDEDGGDNLTLNSFLPDADRML